MSIRPTYRKRSVLQVLADGMSAHPPKPETRINVTANADSTPADFSEKLRKLSEQFKEHVQVRALRDAEGNVVEHVLTPRKFAAGGYVPSPKDGDKSCCEEAELTAAELARRNEELSEAEEEIAALKAQVCDWKSGVETEAWVHDESRDKITEIVNEFARIQGESRAEIKALTKRAEKAEAERDEARSTAGFLAQERDALQAKLDDAEGWPDWLGPKIDPDECEVTPLDGHEYEIDGERWTFLSEWEARDLAARYIEKATKVEAIARFIEDEQAATGDEDQRAEGQAKALYYATRAGIPHLPWEDERDDIRETIRSAIRAGWTPPESEASK